MMFKNPLSTVLLLFLIASAWMPHSFADTDVNTFSSGQYPIELKYAVVDSSKRYLSVIQNGDLDGQWQEVKNNELKLGLGADQIWLKADLSNDHLKELEQLLYIDYCFLDTIHLWLVHDGKVIHHVRAGDTLPFSKRPIDHAKFLFPLEVPPGDSQVYLFIETTGSLNFSVSLWDPKAFIQADAAHLLRDGLIFGIFIIMALYNLFLWFSVRSTSYLFYVSYVVTFGITLAILDGYAFQYLWPNSTWLQSQGVVLFGVTAAICVLSFCVSFLDIKLHYPKLYNVMRWVILTEAVFLVVSLFLPYRVAVKFAMLFVIITSGSAFSLGVYSLKNGFRPARLYVLAWGSLLALTIVYALSTLHIISLGGIAQQALKIGSFLEVCLLSFALADRINHEKREKLIAQNRAIAEERKANDEHQKYLRQKIESQQFAFDAQTQIIQAQAENKAKSEFLATMSHEIRTPLNGVIGMAEMLKEANIEEAEKQYVDIIHSSGQGLLAIINDILDFSKIESGKMTLESIDFDLLQLGKEVTSLFQFNADKKGVELLCHIDPNTPQYLMGDPTRIRQIIINLLGNAFKFTEQGRVELQISSIADADKESEQKHCQRLRIAVKDSGIGISKAGQQKLFQAFSQAEQSTSRQYGGTGLGLNICKKLAELMNGSIHVESEQGQGSTFWVEIQLLDARVEFVESQRKKLEEEAVPAHKQVENSAGSRLAGLRVLVAEDNTVNQLVIKAMLNKLNIKPDLAGDGQEAVKLAGGKEYDLILMDCVMPNLDGYQATRAIRSHEEKNSLKYTPIVALSAHAMDEHRQKSIDAGMDAHLSKPLSLDKLRDCIIEYALQPMKNSA